LGRSCSGELQYEGMASYWPSAKGETAAFMNNVPKVVFSRTLKKAEWNNTRLVHGSAEDEVIRLKQQPGEPGKDLFILGSAELSSSLIQRGLIDEYRFGLTPIVLGNGRPLFKAGTGMRMRLLEAKPLTSGCVILRYKPEMQLRWAPAEATESMEHVG
jgi:dihydrofolate reductase